MSFPSEPSALSAVAHGRFSRGYTRTDINVGHFRRLYRSCHVAAGRGGRAGRGVRTGARPGLVAAALWRLLELPPAQRRGAADGRHLGVPGPAEHHEKGDHPLHGRHRPDHLRRRSGQLGHRHPGRPRGTVAAPRALRGPQ